MGYLTSDSPEEDIRKRKIFFVSALATLVALLSLRFFVLPHFAGVPTPSLSTMAGAVVDTLLVALVGSIAVTILLVWLAPIQKNRSGARVVDSFRIKDIFDQALQDTKTWEYRGNTGRHLRKEIIPRLAEQTKRDRFSRLIKAEILDPSSQKTCEFYAQYLKRRRFGSGRGHPTAEEASKDLYATVLSLYSWSRQVPSLDVSISLTQSVSLFRVDLADNFVLITRQDPAEPALYCEAGTFFYNVFREDLLMSRNQSRLLSREVRGPTLNDLDVESADAILRELGLLPNDFLDESFLADVVAITKGSRSPYV